jgi:hypothetical protein
MVKKHHPLGEIPPAGPPPPPTLLENLHVGKSFPAWKSFHFHSSFQKYPRVIFCFPDGSKANFLISKNPSMGKVIMMKEIFPV